MNDKIENSIKNICSFIEMSTTEEQVKILNYCRQKLHEVSPFKSNPVDFVEWVPADDVRANEYNPNKVAPPEMKLLKLSIDEDGYTQPIVSDRSEDGMREVVDGFHRNRIGREFKEIKKRLHGYLPLVTIRNTKNDIGSRMASTIRHNRARGTHSVNGMSAIVLDYVRLGWGDGQISKHLGMDAEEVVRLKQITGLPEAFSNHTFSKSWEEFESNFEKDNNKNNEE